MLQFYNRWLVENKLFVFVSKSAIQTTVNNFSFSKNGAISIIDINTTFQCDNQNGSIIDYLVFHKYPHNF